MTNERVLEWIDCDCEEHVLSSTIKRQLTYIGHLLRHEGLEKTLLLGVVTGKRNRDRPKVRLGDHFKDVCRKTLVELLQNGTGQGKVEEIRGGHGSGAGINC